MSTPTVIGLAFGNTTSSIAFEKDGKVDLIANQDGDRAIPSVISYVGSDEYHGVQASQQLIRNAGNTAAYFRDFLGVPFASVDPTNNHASAHPHELNGQASFVLKTEDDDEEGEAKPAKPVSVHQVAVRHLDRLRESAADFIGKPIDGAVIAVPTDYSPERRQAIVDAAKDAGLKILQVINEPSAALLAHVSNTASPADKIYAVLDFGGTRSDGAIVSSRGGIFTILSTLHDPELGGKRLDETLVEYVAKEFEKKHAGVDPRGDARAMAKLAAESESVKKTLSNTSSANFAVESVSQGYDFNMSINRLRFELTGRPVFNKFVSFAEQLVKKAGLDVLDIDEVLLVGGSSAIPKVGTSIAAVFDEKVTKVVAPVLDKTALLPEELIARGAAIQASLIAGYDDDDVAESLQAVVTVAPHITKPIGVQVAGGDGFVPVLGAATALPIRKTVTLSTPEGVTDVLVAIYEGESEIKVTVPEKKEKAPKEDDDESDWSEDEEDDEDEIRTKHIKPTKKLAELGLKGIAAGSKVEVILNITRELKLQISAREVRSGGVAVRGEVSAPKA